MPNPGALVSANASLSAMLGGAFGVTGGATASGLGTVAANGAQSTDFSAVLSGQTALAAASAPRVKLSAASGDAVPSIALSDDDSAMADTADPQAADQAANGCGKTLPFAAIANAILPPVPVTLSALAPKATGQANAQDDSSDTDTPADSDTATPNLDARALTLMAAAQGPGATDAAALTATTQAAGQAATQATDSSDTQSFPRISLASASAAFTRKGARTTRQALAQIQNAGTSSLPQPGFTLIPDAGTAMTATPSLASAQGDVTISADTAIAMAGSTRLASADPQPGFTLLSDTSDASDTAQASGATPALASRATATPTPDMAVAMASGSAVDMTRLATTAGIAATPAGTAAAPVGVATTPAGLPQPAQVAQADSPEADETASAAPAPTASARLATRAQGRIAARNAAQASGQDDASPSSPHPSASPPMDDASMPDNAPSSIQHLASASTANLAQTLAATGGAATLSTASLASANLAGAGLANAAQAGAAQTGGTDMAALVDRLVEARAAARSGLGTQSVQASVAHADFGRVSLRFNQDDSGLNVSMSSRDPAFAPAAQAALAQAPAVAAGAQSQGAGQQNSSQQGSGQPGQPWAQAGLNSGMQAGTGNQNGGSNSQGWAQGGQNGGPYAQQAPSRQDRAALAASATTQASARSRGGILA